jgi:hypothetical protein
MANRPSANGHAALGSEVVVPKDGHQGRSRQRSQRWGASDDAPPIAPAANANCDNMFEPVC